MSELSELRLEAAKIDRGYRFAVAAIQKNDRLTPAGKNEELQAASAKYDQQVRTLQIEL